MGFAAELIRDVDEDDDEHWSVAGDTIRHIFTQACVRISDTQANGMSRGPSPPPLPATSPSPNLLMAQDGAKTLIGIALQGVDDDSEDLRSTVGGASVLAEDSRSTVYQDDFNIGDGDDTAKGVTQDDLEKDKLEKSPEKARTALEKADMLEIGRTLRSALERAARDGTLEKAMLTITGGKADVFTARKIAAETLVNAVEDGRLAAALQSLNTSESDTEEARLLTQSLLMQGLADGRLEALLKNGGIDSSCAEVRALKAMLQGLEDGSLVALLAEGQVDGDTEEVRSLAKNAILQGLADGRLDTLLSEASGAIGDDSEEVRTLTRSAIQQGLADGRLDALLAETSGQSATASTALVPQPPPGAPTGSPTRSRKLVAGSNSNAGEVMQMISDADRKVGSLQVQVAEKERQIKDRDIACQQLQQNIQLAQSDFEHLSIDLQWHQEQITYAEGRWDRLNEDRRALALKLDEMRSKELKDDWPPSAKQSQTARSWTSTTTAATTAIESSYSGFNTDRSAMSTRGHDGTLSAQQTFVTQHPPGTT